MVEKNEESAPRKLVLFVSLFGGELQKELLEFESKWSTFEICKGSQKETRLARVNYPHGGLADGPTRAMPDFALESE